MLVYYELDMICRDTQGILLPYLPERWHPAIVEMARLCQPTSDGPASQSGQSLGEPIGQLEQLVFERHLLDRSKAAVTGQFAHDVDLLDRDRRRRSPHARHGPQPRQCIVRQPDRANVGFIELAHPLVGTAGQESPSGRLTLVGSGGRAVITMPSATAPAGDVPAAAAHAEPALRNFELSVAGSRMERQLDTHWNPAAAALDGLASHSRC